MAEPANLEQALLGGSPSPSGESPEASAEPDTTTMDPGLEFAAEEVMGALSAGDTKAFVQSMKDFMVLMRAGERESEE